MTRLEIRNSLPSCSSRSSCSSSLVFAVVGGVVVVVVVAVLLLEEVAKWSINVLYNLVFIVDKQLNNGTSL